VLGEWGSRGRTGGLGASYVRPAAYVNLYGCTGAWVDGERVGRK